MIWFFPDSHLGHRTCPSLEILVAVVFAASGLLWLRGHHWKDQARRVLKLIPENERMPLKHGSWQDYQYESCLAATVDRQRLLIEGFPVFYGIYQWWSESWRYVGVGKLQRDMHPI